MSDYNTRGSFIDANLENATNYHFRMYIQYAYICFRLSNCGAL